VDNKTRVRVFCGYIKSIETFCWKRNEHDGDCATLDDVREAAIDELTIE
jgi:hypothetical protein